MKIDEWIEPKEEYIKRMICPGCGKKQIRWAVLRYRSENGPEEDYWLECKSCGYNLHELQYPYALYGLQFLEEDWSITSYDSEIDEDNNVISFTMVLRPMPGRKMSVEELQDLLHQGIREEFY